MDFKLIAGLGNPDPGYANTYHNVGSLFLGYVLSDNTLAHEETVKKFKAIKTKHAVFIYPLVYMNTSGVAVSQALRYFKVKPSQLLLVHDDSDIALGKYRFSYNRGSAGHHGVESVVQYLKTKEFWRLRIGIRKNTPARSKARDLVLKAISRQDQVVFQGVFAELKEVIAKVTEKVTP